MSSTTTIKAREVPPPSYKKRLLGVRATKELQSQWKEALAVAQKLEQDGASLTTIPPLVANTSDEDDEKKDTPSSKTAFLIRRARSRMDIDEARELVLTWKDPPQRNNDVIPVDILRAMEALLQAETESSKDSKATQLMLETALATTQLAFTAPPKPGVDDNNNDNNATTAEQKRFRQRMERLKLKQEENKYSKLTDNLKPSYLKNTDDVTTKSMTYATSVGLNMIVAPLSFGCFMYFFAGGLFDFFGGSDGMSGASSTMRRGPGYDHKRVIAAVISGVFMLFVEMLLFVIRTHELDRAMLRKRAKKEENIQTGGAFGHYTSNTVRDFRPRE